LKKSSPQERAQFWQFITRCLFLGMAALNNYAIGGQLSCD